MKHWLYFIVFVTPFNLAFGQDEILLVPPSGAVQAGQSIHLTLYFNNPADTSRKIHFPEAMQGVMATAQASYTLPVALIGEPPGASLEVASMSYQQITITVVVPDTAAGTASFRLMEPRSNPIMFSIAEAAVVHVTPTAVKAAETAASLRETDLDLSNSYDYLLRHISPYEPMYFAVGKHDDATARFQFSIKYRVLPENGDPLDVWRDIYLGYTQTSVWDLTAPSAPFLDTSYKPGIFYYRDSFDWKPSWLSRLGLQVGLFQHESNGNAGVKSRSLNTVFVTPSLGFDLGRRWRLYAAPRFIEYVEKADNRDIAKYRGNVDWVLRVGQERGVLLSADLRLGTGGHYGSQQYDLSYPLARLPDSSGLGGYLQLQYFTGYGETLLDYNERGPDELRIGFMMVR